MAAMLILKAMTGDLRGQEFALTGPAHCVLGRSRGCTLRLPGDATVSRQHCLLELDDSGAWAQDLGSLNGTYVNRRRIDGEEVLEDGDELQIGKFRLTYLVG